LAFDARRDLGYGSPYDEFIYKYVGHPVLPDFPPISRTAPSGVTYNYNNPTDGQVRRNYTEQGNIVNIRYAQGVVGQGDEQYNYFVASLDLHTGQIVEWEVVGVERSGLFPGQQSVIINLADPSSAGRPAVAHQADPVKAEIARRQQARSCPSAQVILGMGSCTFQMNSGPAEHLRAIAELAKEVDELTGEYGLTVADLEARRQRAAWRLASMAAQAELAA
jgi:hypothetical protein